MHVHGIGSHPHDQFHIWNLAPPAPKIGVIRSVQALRAASAADDEAVLRYASESDIARGLASLSAAHSVHRASAEQSEDLSIDRLGYAAATYGSYMNAAAIAQAGINTSAYVTALPQAEQSRFAANQLLLSTGDYESRRSRLAAFGNTIRSAASRLWNRAPLLLLLLGWLAIGLGAGAVLLLLRAIAPASAIGAAINSGFNLWGVGFLALIGLGFYMRVRNVRF